MLAGGLHEHFFWGRARSWERVLLLIAAIVLITPGWRSDLVGVVLIAAPLLVGTAVTAPKAERTPAPVEEKPGEATPAAEPDIAGPSPNQRS